MVFSLTCKYLITYLIFLSFARTHTYVLFMFARASDVSCELTILVAPRLPGKMEQSTVFVDMLVERRKDYDISWVTRPMNPLLPHKLPPALRYSREETTECIMSSARIRSTIEKLAAANGVNVKDIEKKARAILHEMASKEDLTTVRWLGTRALVICREKHILVIYTYLPLLIATCTHVRIAGIFITKAMKRMFSKIYVNECRLLSLKQEMQISQVQYVYMPSHRSYLDFILLSYVLFSYDMALPNIASGIDFYKMKIVGELLRKTGAFYMRRSFSNDLLYKEIFRSYINTIVCHSGRAIEFFIEGTRSRSQKSISPKYGEPLADKRAAGVANGGPTVVLSQACCPSSWRVCCRATCPTYSSCR